MADTKEEILQSSLRLFAKDGYEAVSVSTIAAEVGITKGALYKHYKNKRDIFDSIVRRMEEIDEKRLHDFQMPEGSTDNKAIEFRKMPLEKVEDYSLAMLKHWTTDEFAANFRRVITIEQYRNPEMAELYQKYLASGAIKYIANVFATMLDDKEHARELAIRFYAPIFLLYSMSDAGEDDDTLEKILRRHVENFEQEVGKRRKEL